VRVELNLASGGDPDGGDQFAEQDWQDLDDSFQNLHLGRFVREASCPTLSQLIVTEVFNEEEGDYDPNDASSQQVLALLKPVPVFAHADAAAEETLMSREEVSVRACRNATSKGVPLIGGVSLDDVE